MKDNIWTDDYGKLLLVDEVEGGLQLLADDDPDSQTSTTVALTLDLNAVRKLRLVLQRYEKEHK